jgi:hypothetical protein
MTRFFSFALETSDEVSSGTVAGTTRIRVLFLIFLGLALVLLLVTVLYVGTLLSASKGRAVSPLDDAYIHFQYARQLARGHPWQYNDGEPFSTGATSPLYPFLLAAGYLAGFGGERLVWFALALGVVSLALSAWLVYRITRRLVQPETHPEAAWLRWVPAGATLFFLLSGAIQWTYFSGMESGIFTVLVLAALDAYLSFSNTATRRAALWIALAALVRPEGLFLAAILWLVTLAQYLTRSQVLSSSKDTQYGIRNTVHSSLLTPTLAVLVALLPFLLNALLTGSPIASGAQAKSWLGNVPFRPLDILGSITHSYWMILERFVLGLWATRPWYLVPGGLLLAGIGWIDLLRRRRWWVVALTLGWFFIGLLSTATLITATWHVGRYQVPFLALLIPFAALGLVALACALPGRWTAPAATGLTLVLLAVTLVALAQSVDVYYRAVYTVTNQQLALADWIDANLPSDVRVGVHDTGAIRYVGRRPTYDMIGLTTRDAATPWRHGAGAAYEQLEDVQAQPDYFATYPDAFSIPYLAATDLFAVELFRAEVPNFAITSAGPTQAVFRADWHLAGSGDRMHQADVQRLTQAMALVDDLDLADLEDEAAHALTFWEDEVYSGFPTEVQQFFYRTDPTIEVLDGGRQVTGGLAFQMATLPGRPLLLVARIHADQAGAVRVLVDGRDLGRWRFPAALGQWLETAFLVPAETVTQDGTEIRLEVDAQNPDFRYLSLYYVWAWQGQPNPITVDSQHALPAKLGDAIALVGYDLPTHTYAPGESIDLTLYWHALAQPQEDAKVFVHLYDPSGEVVTQQDHRPYYDTRPPYTWSPGEYVADPYTLIIPPHLLPGQYTIGVGMYHPDTQVRLPVNTDPAHTLPDDRIRLDTITLQAPSQP